MSDRHSIPLNELLELVNEAAKREFADVRSDMRLLAELVVWALAVEVRQAKEEIMAAIDDLSTSVASLNTAVAGVGDRVAALVASEAAKDPAISAAAAAVQSAVDTLNGVLPAPVLTPTP
jgi:hypothetical protein